MTNYACIFGRNPDLSLLELKAVAPFFDAQVVKMLEKEIALLSAASPLSEQALERLQLTLGGTVRIAELITSGSSVLELCEKVVRDRIGEGKVTIGLSTWSNTGRPQAPFPLARKLKAKLVAAGHSVRIVTRDEPTHLSGAQILHNKLVGNPRAIDLVCIWTGTVWEVGITRAAQDITDYSRRDFNIPYPDAVSGMLPPKLAQIMVNLGVRDQRDLAVFDPFCGNGRVLLEASLLGLTVFGADILDKQVEATQGNLEWLRNDYGCPVDAQVWQADAREGAGRSIGLPFVIVTEPFLGKPLRSALHPDQKVEWLGELVPMFEKFLGFWAQHHEQPRQMVVIFPRAKVSDGSEASVFEVIVDRLHQIGYSAEVLFCYDRPDSLVRRDIVSITKSQ